MSTLGSPVAPTPTVTTKSTIWRQASPNSLTLWPCWLVRTDVVFAAVQAGLLAVVAIAALRSDNSVVRIGLPLMLLSFQLCLYFNRVHERLLEADLREFVARSSTAILEGVLLGLFVCYFVPRLWMSYPEALAAALISVLALVAAVPIIRALVERRWLVEGLLILGSGETSRRLRDEITRLRAGSRNFGAGDGAGAPLGSPGEECVSLACGDLREWASQHGYSRIIVAEPGVGDGDALATTLIECKARGLYVEHAMDSFGRLRSKLWLEAMRPEWLVYATGFRASPSYLRLKRVADVVGALVLTTLTAPLLLLAAVAIKLESPGPVLFWQERIGLNGKRFLLAKFRSMRDDAERDRGPTWARVDDPRITQVGRLLRKFRIDEIPQVINVLKGEMSLIGPRPERPYFVERLSRKVPYYHLRHSVKPGITGWAQVMYPYGASVKDAYEKLQLDLYYLQNVSLLFDTRILLHTFRVVLAGHGR